MAKYTAISPCNNPVLNNNTGIAWLRRLCLLICIAPVGLFAQPTADSLRLLYELPEKAAYFTVDKLGQVYLATPSNEVIKYSPEGQELFRYNNNTIGDLSYIDVTDPFNVLLFYHDFQTIATLDRTMNERAVMLLYNANIIEASAIGLARDNNIWVYDQVTFTLKKIGADGRVITDSGNLSAILNMPLYASQIMARDNFVYVYHPSEGLFIFDNFTQYHNKIPYKDFDSFQLLDDLVLFYKKNELLAYHSKRLKTYTIPLPDQAKQAQKVHYQDGQYYLLMPTGLLLVYQKMK
jgi:peroxiredoxin family protein